MGFRPLTAWRKGLESSPASASLVMQTPTAGQADWLQGWGSPTSFGFCLGSRGRVQEAGRLGSFEPATARERPETLAHTGVPKGAKASGLPAWGDSFENQPDAALSCPLNPAIPKALTSPARMRQLPEPFPPNEKTRAKSSPTACSLHSKARGGLCQRSASLLPPIFRTLPGSAFLQGVADPLPTLAADQTGDRYECARPPARHVEPVTATADGYQCSPWAKAVFSKCFPDTVVINSHRN